MEGGARPRYPTSEREGLLRVIRRQNRYIETLLREMRNVIAVGRSLCDTLPPAISAAQCTACRSMLPDSNVRVCACGYGMHAECYSQRMQCVMCVSPYYQRHREHFKRRAETRCEGDHRAKRLAVETAPAVDRSPIRHGATPERSPSHTEDGEVQSSSETS